MPFEPATPSERAEHRILLVEDEQHLAAGLKLNLELEGYAVQVAATAQQAAGLLLQPEAYDVILLDVMLPDFDGFEFCQRVRKAGNYVPIIMLTARAAAEDRVRGLEAGADDYLVKPFELNELLARVRSSIRRRHWEQGQEPAPGAVAQVLTFGSARIDFGRHVAVVEEKEVHLTQLELDLLRYFAQNPGRVLGRQELLEQVWKLRNVRHSRTVDNFMSRLRRHFERDAADPEYFVSVRGAGYRFVPEGRET